MSATEIYMRTDVPVIVTCAFCHKKLEQMVYRVDTSDLQTLTIGTVGCNCAGYAAFHKKRDEAIDRLKEEARG